MNDDQVTRRRTSYLQLVNLINVAVAVQLVVEDDHQTTSSMYTVKPGFHSNAIKSNEIKYILTTQKKQNKQTDENGKK